MVFGVGQFDYASHIWLGHTFVALATKICDFQQKIGYNSSCAGDTPQIRAPTREFSGSANLIMSNFAQRTPVAMVTKNWEFYHKFAITSVDHKMES